VTVPHISALALNEKQLAKNQLAMKCLLWHSRLSPFLRRKGWRRPKTQRLLNARSRLPPLVPHSLGQALRNYLGCFSLLHIHKHASRFVIEKGKLQEQLSRLRMKAVTKCLLRFPGSKFLALRTPNQARNRFEIQFDVRSTGRAVGAVHIAPPRQ
jgi:hypothetical protein